MKYEKIPETPDEVSNESEIRYVLTLSLSETQHLGVPLVKFCAKGHGLLHHQLPESPLPAAKI